jgi:hypothetical protein
MLTMTITEQDVLDALRSKAGMFSTKRGYSFWDVAYAVTGLAVEQSVYTRQTPTQQFKAAGYDAAALRKTILALIDRGDLLLLSKSEMVAQGLSTRGMQPNERRYHLAEQVQDAAVKADLRRRNSHRVDALAAAERSIVHRYRAEVRAEYEALCKEARLDPMIEAES